MDALLHRLKKAVAVIAVLLIIAAVLLIPVALDLGHAGALTPIALLVLGLTVFLLTRRSPMLARFFSRFRVWLILPTARDFLEEQERRLANQVVVQKMDDCLKFYGLDGVPEAVRADLIGSGPGEDVAERCAREMQKRLAPGHPGVSPDVLLFLYEEMHGDYPANTWRLRQPELLRGLAQILADCRVIREAVERIVPDGIMLEEILQLLDQYSLGGVTRIWVQVSKYLSFLEKNGLKRPVISSPDALRVLPRSAAKYDVSISELDAGRVGLLGSLGLASLRATFDPLPDASWGLKPEASAEERSKAERELLEALSLVSLAIFLQEFEAPDAAAKRAVCRQAAGIEQAAWLALGYLESREDIITETLLGGLDFVSVRYLAENWAQRVGRRREEPNGFNREIREIKASLKRGEWLTRLPYLVDRTIKKIVAEELRKTTDELKLAIEQSPGVLEGLRGAFRRVSTATIERFLEAQSFAAYLLTFDTESGSFADVIDSLVSPQPEIRSKLIALGIAPDTDGRPKYVFRKYTKNARIGLVPRGWSFKRFYRELQDDLTTVIDKRETLLPNVDWKEHPLEQLELIVQRFGLLGRDHYGFRSTYRKDHAIPKIRELFSETLDLDEMISVVGYELPQDDLGTTLTALADKILAGSIAELLDRTVDAKQRAAIERQDTDLVLKQQWVEKLGSANVSALGREVVESDKKRRAAQRSLAQVLTRNVPEVAKVPHLSTAAASEYVDTLAAIARVTLCESTTPEGVSAHEQRK